ncbi:MAG: hypothetical protein AAGH15_28810, partial [Myxococcota bacterium]
SMSRSDVFRSFVRAGADGMRQRLRGAAPVAVARRVLRELQQQRALLDERQLTAAVARTPELSSASVTARHGGLQVDASFEGGETIAFRLEPFGTRFAARGAKEVTFRVEPAALVSNAKVRAIVGSLAGSVAFALWGVVLGRPNERELLGAIVERDGNAMLRVDLRTVPAVRALERKGPAAMVLDVMELERVSVEEGSLVLKLKLPGLPG